ncbi:MAG: hypothetical protein LBJ32_03065, partial [Oscillospiraceae bacterium]|nr:hypothetical protein [Oscillospiraceae bacterium]
PQSSGITEEFPFTASKELNNTYSVKLESHEESLLICQGSFLDKLNNSQSLDRSNFQTITEILNIFNLQTEKNKIENLVPCCFKIIYLLHLYDKENSGNGISLLDQQNETMLVNKIRELYACHGIRLPSFNGFELINPQEENSLENVRPNSSENQDQLEIEISLNLQENTNEISEEVKTNDTEEGREDQLNINQSNIEENQNQLIEIPSNQQEDTEDDPEIENFISSIKEGSFLYRLKNSEIEEKNDIVRASLIAQIFHLQSRFEGRDIKCIVNQCFRIICLLHLYDKKNGGGGFLYKSRGISSKRYNLSFSEEKIERLYKLHYGKFMLPFCLDNFLGRLKYPQYLTLKDRKSIRRLSQIFNLQEGENGIEGLADQIFQIICDLYFHYTGSHPASGALTFGKIQFAMGLRPIFEQVIPNFEQDEEEFFNKISEIYKEYLSIDVVQKAERVHSIVSQEFFGFHGLSSTEEVRQYATYLFGRKNKSNLFNIIYKNTIFHHGSILPDGSLTKEFKFNNSRIIDAELYHKIRHLIEAHFPFSTFRVIGFGNLGNLKPLSVENSMFGDYLRYGNRMTTILTDEKESFQLLENLEIFFEACRRYPPELMYDIKDEIVGSLSEEISTPNFIKDNEVIARFKIIYADFEIRFNKVVFIMNGLKNRAFIFLNLKSEELMKKFFEHYVFEKVYSEKNGELKFEGYIFFGKEILNYIYFGSSCKHRITGAYHRAGIRINSLGEEFGSISLGENILPHFIKFNDQSTGQISAFGLNYGHQLDFGPDIVGFNQPLPKILVEKAFNEFCPINKMAQKLISERIDNPVVLEKYLRLEVPLQVIETIFGKEFIGNYIYFSHLSKSPTEKLFSPIFISMQRQVEEIEQNKTDSIILQNLFDILNSYDPFNGVLTFMNFDPEDYNEAQQNRYIEAQRYMATKVENFLDDCKKSIFFLPEDKDLDKKSIAMAKALLFFAAQRKIELEPV